MRHGADADRPSPDDKKTAERKRLAEALRANLKRRKNAAANRADTVTNPPDDTEPGAQ